MEMLAKAEEPLRSATTTLSVTPGFVQRVAAQPVAQMRMALARLSIVFSHAVVHSSRRPVERRMLSRGDSSSLCVDGSRAENDLSTCGLTTEAAVLLAFSARCNASIVDRHSIVETLKNFSVSPIVG